MKILQIVPTSGHWRLTVTAYAGPGWGQQTLVDQDVVCWALVEQDGGEPAILPCILTGATVAPWTPLSAPHSAQYTLERLRDATAHGEWRAT